MEKSSWAPGEILVYPGPDAAGCGGEMAERAEAAPRADKNETMETFKAIAVAVAIFLAFRILAFQPFTIPSSSMEPQLQIGDYVIVSKYPYGWSRHSIPLSPPLFSGRI